jgi:hypothetical protein
MDFLHVGEYFCLYHVYAWRWSNADIADLLCSKHIPCCLRFSDISYCGRWHSKYKVSEERPLSVFSKGEGNMCFRNRNICWPDYTEWRAEDNNLNKQRCENSNCDTTNKKKHTPWLESAGAKYTDRPSDRRLSAKLVPTLADRGCRVVNATNPQGS